jgi:antitoxin component HigA of HigAB toxin-antitoxin module
MKGVRAIGTEADYDSALDDIECYFVKQLQPGTEDAERFDVLADLIEPMRPSIGQFSRQDVSDMTETDPIVCSLEY